MEKKEKAKEFVYQPLSNHSFPPAPYQEDEIDLLELWGVLWRRKLVVFLVTFLATAASIIVALKLPKIYRSEVVILPTSEKQTIPSGLSGLAAVAGISLPVSSNEAEIEARLRSKALYARIIKKYNLLPILFPKRLRDPEKPPTIDDGIRKFKNSIVHISKDRKTGTITISVDFYDPREAARLAGLIVKELRDVIVSSTISKAKKTLKELEKTLPRVSDPLVQQKIYNLMAKQIETISLARAGEAFAFKVIDPPRVPDKKYKPKRRLIVMVSFVSSLFIGIFLVFFLEYVENAKKRLKEKSKDGEP